MQYAMALLLNASKYLGSPIDGPPTEVARYLYSGSVGKVGFSWTLGDADAGLQVSIDGGDTVDRSFPAKTIQWDTGYTEAQWYSNSYVFAVRHVNGIYTSDWAFDEEAS